MYKDPIAKGMCGESLEEIKALVEGHVSRTPNTKKSCLECK
jgi:hypothetical protein